MFKGSIHSQVALRIKSFLKIYMEEILNE